MTKEETAPRQRMNRTAMLLLTAAVAIVVLAAIGAIILDNQGRAEAQQIRVSYSLSWLSPSDNSVASYTYSVDNGVTWHDVQGISQITPPEANKAISVLVKATGTAGVQGQGGTPPATQPPGTATLPPPVQSTSVPPATPRATPQTAQSQQAQTKPDLTGAPVANDATGILLSYTFNTNQSVFGYEVQRSTTGQRNSWTTQYSDLQGYDYLTKSANSDTSAGSFRDANLSVRTTYYYRIRAEYADGTLSDWSDTASVTTLSPSPFTPRLSANWVEGEGIVLTWVKDPQSPGAGSPTKFEIQVSQDGTSWTSLSVNGCAPGIEDECGVDDWKVADPNTSDTWTYTHWGMDELVQNRTYHHRVKSKDTRGQPPYSASTWSNTTATKVPAARQQAPDVQVRAVGSAAAEVAWSRYEVDQPVTPATRQEIQGSKDSGVTWSTVASNLQPNIHSYLHTGLTAGDTWRYRVRVLNAGGWSEWTHHEDDGYPTPSATVGQNAGPMPPTGTTATPEGPTNIRVEWTAPVDTGNSAIVWYEVQCTDDGYWPSHTCAGFTSWPGYEEVEHLGLTGGDSYSYRVRAHNSDGAGAWSSMVTAQTKAGSPHAPPTLDAVAVDKSSIKLTWTAPPETVSRYIVERYDHHVPDDQFAEVINNISGTATSWTDTGLYEGSGYSYRIRGYNSKGYGAWSYQAAEYTEGRYPQEPGRVQHIYRTALSANSVTLAWEPPADDGGRPITGYGYEMTHSCGTDGITQIASGTTAAATRTVTINLSGAACEAVSFDVRAKNMIGDGEISWGHTTYRPNYGGKGSLNINKTKITLNEGSSTTLTISLSEAPTKNLTLWYNWDGDYDAASTLDAAQFLSITPSNWNSIPAITVTAPTDANTEDETASLNFAIETDVVCPAGHRETREACDAYIEENKDPKFHYVSGNGLLVTFRDTGAN